MSMNDCDAPCIKTMDDEIESCFNKPSYTTTWNCKDFVKCTCCPVSFLCMGPLRYVLACQRLSQSCCRGECEEDRTCSYCMQVTCPIVYCCSVHGTYKEQNEGGGRQNPQLVNACTDCSRLCDAQCPCDESGDCVCFPSRFVQRIIKSWKAGCFRRS